MDCSRSAACRAQEETLKLNKTYTEFVFFKASPDERRKSPCSITAAPKPTAPPLAPPMAPLLAPPLAGLKTGLGAGFRTGRRARGKLARDDSLPRPDQSVGTRNDGLLRYVAGIIIAPEYKPAAGACRSPGARGTLPHPRYCVSLPLLKARGKGRQPSSVSQEERNPSVDGRVRQGRAEPRRWRGMGPQRARRTQRGLYELKIEREVVVCSQVWI